MFPTFHPYHVEIIQKGIAGWASLPAEDNYSRV